MNFNSFLNELRKTGLTYTQHSAETAKYIEQFSGINLSPIEAGNYNYIKLNHQRSTRIDKNFVPDEEITSIVNKIKEPQLWMVITEASCGDSAQNVPYINKLAELNKNINLRLVPRDENPEIMDKYLTNGTRSIPMLVAFNNENEELFKWGSRPEEGAKIIKEEKEAGTPKAQMYEKLHFWYAKNKGEAVLRELITLIEQTVSDPV